MAGRYVELILRYQERGPYHLLGLCFGGIVAYEVAAQLEARGHAVSAVTIIDAILPNAISVDRVKQLETYARRALEDPAQLKARVRKKAMQVAERVPALRFALAGRLPSAAGTERAVLVDLPVDGPEVDDQIAAFTSRPGRIAARLLVVRATTEALAPWKTVAGDQGWGSRAANVVVHDIPATHMGVLKEPHVRSLAEAVQKLSTGGGGAPPAN